MTITENVRDTAEMLRTTICGHGFVPGAHAGRPFLEGSDFVALKIMKVVETMESTIKEQEKLTPRRTIFAILTLVLIFWQTG